MTVYLVIKKKESFLGIKPLSPIDLKTNVITLGASFIKLAQVLATRADFFDEKYLCELKELHDDIPSMTVRDFEGVFNQAFPKNPFKSFEKEAIASASIGQGQLAA
jgi:predicted unusual protein kinase regulating ubiquinone biosynthesis (AarF/ABC1/UbiB family)